MHLFIIFLNLITFTWAGPADSYLGEIKAPPKNLAEARARCSNGQDKETEPLAEEVQKKLQEEMLQAGGGGFAKGMSQEDMKLMPQINSMATPPVEIGDL